MGSTIKINDDDIVSDVRQESALMSRSIGDQAAHWIKIGRWVERSNRFNMAKIYRMLKGEVSPDELFTDEEVAVYAGQFEDALIQQSITPTIEQTSFFNKRAKEGLGVGMDDKNRIIRQQDVNASNEKNRK